MNSVFLIAVCFDRGRQIAAPTGSAKDGVPHCVSHSGNANYVSGDYYPRFLSWILTIPFPIFNTQAIHLPGLLCLFSTVVLLFHMLVFRTVQMAISGRVDS